jgi:hypothetical protein
MKERWKDRSDKKKQRRRKQLQDDLKESIGYWKLNEEAVDRAVWRSGFGRD